MIVLFFLPFAYLIGMIFGVLAEAARWRRRGDHEYMNRIESGGKLYIVKGERP